MFLDSEGNILHATSPLYEHGDTHKHTVHNTHIDLSNNPEANTQCSVDFIL